MCFECTICSLNVKPESDSANATICGHIFHNACLEEWLLRSKTCPQCRTFCEERQLRPLYFNTSLNNSTVDVETIQIELGDAKLEIENLKKDLAQEKNVTKDVLIKQKKLKQIFAERESRSHQLNKKQQQDSIEIDLLKKERNRLSIVETHLNEKVVLLERQVKVAEKNKLEFGNKLKISQSENLKLIESQNEFIESLRKLCEKFKIKGELISSLQNNRNKDTASTIQLTSALAPSCSSHITMRNNSQYLTRKLVNHTTEVVDATKEVSYKNLPTTSYPRKYHRSLAGNENSSNLDIGRTERKDSSNGNILSSVFRSNNIQTKNVRN